MAETALELCLFGCGQIAKAYTEALQRVPHLRLCCGIDPDESAREAFAARTGLPTFACLDAAIAAGIRPQAALVLTPPNSHEALAIELCERGLHVLCEKPLAPTTEAAERMFAAAARHDRLLMMGSKFRYTKDVAAAHDLLADGFCGDVVLFENVFCSHVDMSTRWNAIAEQSGGGVLIDNGCHSVDIARFLLGPIASVQAQFGRITQPIAVEDTARLLFTSKSGVLGSIDLSWSMHKETASYVRIHGTEGTIEIGWQHSRKKKVGAKDWTVFGQGYDKIAAFPAQLQNFADVILGTARPVIDRDDALASVAVIEQAYRSQRCLAPFQPDS